LLERLDGIAWFEKLAETRAVSRRNVRLRRNPRVVGVDRRQLFGVLTGNRGEFCVPKSHPVARIPLEKRRREVGKLSRKLFLFSLWRLGRVERGFRQPEEFTHHARLVLRIGEARCVKT